MFDFSQALSGLYKTVWVVFPPVMVYLGLRLTYLLKIAELVSKDAAGKVELVRLQAIEAAAKVELVRLALITSDHKMDGIAKVTKATHSLVNAKWGEALRVRQIETQARADREDDPSFQQIADEAAADYRDHMGRQVEVDAQPGTDAEKSGRKSASPPPSADAEAQQIADLSVAKDRLVESYSKTKSPGPGPGPESR